MNDNMEEKRMAGDYEIIQAVQIGDREVVLGENPQDETGMKYPRGPFSPPRPPLDGAGGICAGHH